MERLRLDLGWAKMHFVPHSMRYGGAVYDLGVPNLLIADIQHRGRWATYESCDSYVSKCTSGLFQTCFPRNSCATHVCKTTSRRVGTKTQCSRNFV